MTIHPTVRNGYITQIHLDDILLPLRTSVPIEKLDELIDLVEKVDQYFNLAPILDPTRIPEPFTWTEDHILRVIKVNYGNKLFLGILCNRTEPVGLVEAAELANTGYENMRGAVTSVSRYTNVRRLPPLYTKGEMTVRKPCGTGSHKVLTYLLRDKVRDPLCTVLQKILGPGQRRPDQ